MNNYSKWSCWIGSERHNRLNPLSSFIFNFDEFFNPLDFSLFLEAYSVEFF